ncbi:TonB-dependent receptor [Leptospira yasudae]|uniref:TonB-dependent receptor n=2 Tax=Leptospira yasudae TaxID=2202201 RepID=A0A6N4QZZ1_9LEPT|nr:TonB-dependent receptor [Leptospira yasudae]TGL76167.1 TonB-dependent receptor [Leptospira yasudae]TGL79318.1 TonB-dependent receptor [Leptospira yasudae]TGL83005.1 TonB-dependent receptor [Leptospira yasudae]
MMRQFLTVLLGVFCCTIPIVSQTNQDPNGNSVPKKEPIKQQGNSEEADETPEESRWKKTEIRVIGEKKDLKRIPGSATIIGKKYLEQARPTDGMEVLRRVPGASIRYQDPAGLTMNLGFRGVSNEVSRKVLILEDGLFTSLNPYGEPEMYYTPSIERMERIEVVKGSGSILFGPSTIGGVVNFITRRPPKDPTFSVQTIGGENRYLSSMINYGGTFGNTGFDINVLRKQGDGFRNHQGFFVNEANLKTVHQLNEKHSLTTKVGFHQQESQATYVGLTTGMFQHNPKDNPAENDKRTIERYSFSLGHEWNLGDKTKLITRIYSAYTQRNWARQEYSRNSSASSTRPVDTLNTFDGEPFTSRYGDTIWMRGTNAHRDRTYKFAGIESKLETEFDTGSLKHELDLGIRYHYDSARAQLLTGPRTYDAVSYPNGYPNPPIVPIESRTSLAKSGDLRDDEQRNAKALSVYVQDRIRFTEKLAVIPGVRYESFTQSRLIMRGRQNFDEITFNYTAGTNPTFQFDKEGKTTQQIVLPGFGITYDLFDQFTWFSGIHRGFAPPRYESAISPTGQDLALKAEKSWNYETGVRGDITDYLNLQLVGYFLDFQDQIINSSAAGGNLGARPINAGKSQHKGVETNFTFDFGNFFHWNMNVPFDVIYTRNEAKSNQYTYNLDAWIKSNPDPLLHKDTNGNWLPYVSKDVATLAIGIIMKSGFYVRAEWQYFSKQFHDLQNTRTVYWYDTAASDSQIKNLLDYNNIKSDADGLNGVIPAYELVNVNMGYKKNNWSLFISGKNLQDRRYISTRLPEGIQPGLFRQINVGFTIQL